jgi:hypothetical protein
MSDNKRKDAVAPEKLPELETVCDRCNGTGGSRDGGEWSDCHDCAGVGHIPTEYGKKVLALIQNNISLNPGSAS